MGIWSVGVHTWQETAVAVQGTLTRCTIAYKYQPRIISSDDGNEPRGSGGMAASVRACV